MKAELTKAQMGLKACITKQQDLRSRIDKIESDTTITETYKQSSREKLSSEATAFFTEFKDIFYDDIFKLQTAYEKILYTWTNANSPQINTVLQMISMGIEPPTPVIEQFRGDCISLDIISKALKTKKMLPLSIDIDPEVSFAFFDEINEKFHKACSDWKFNGFYRVDAELEILALKMGYDYQPLIPSDGEETLNIRAIMGL